MAGQDWHRLTEDQKQTYRDESTLMAAQNSAAAVQAALTGQRPQTIGLQVSKPEHKGPV